MTKGTKLKRAYPFGSRHALVAFAAGSALLLAGPTARAQGWLADRSSTEGAGLRVGNLELHPGIGGEVGYDSNWFLRSDKTNAALVNGAPAAPVRDAAVFRVTPSLSLTTLSGQRLGETTDQPVIFKANLAGTYRAFIGSEEIRQQSSSISAAGDVRAIFAPNKPWSFSVFGSEVRTIQPNSLSNQGNPDLAYNSDTLGVGGELVAQPHSGTLDMRLGYQLHYTVFEDNAGKPYDNLLHDVSLRGRWKFRPQTAFVYDGVLGFQTYTDSADQNTELHNSTPIRARIGLSGLVTPRLSAQVLGGWGASFYSPNSNTSHVQQYDSFIANAQLSYSLASNPRDEPGSASLTLSSVTLGYNRDFQNSYLSDYYGTDRGFLRFSYFFANRLLINVEGGAGAIEYPTIYYSPAGGTISNTPINASFTDARVDASVFGEYRITSSFAVNASFNYAQNISNTELKYTTATGNGATTNELYDMAWKRFQAFAGVRWFL